MTTLLVRLFPRHASLSTPKTHLVNSCKSSGGGTLEGDVVRDEEEQPASPGPGQWHANSS